MCVGESGVILDKIRFLSIYSKFITIWQKKIMKV